MLAFDVVFECVDFLGTVFMIGWMFFFAACALIDFAVALDG